MIGVLVEFHYLNKYYCCYFCLVQRGTVVAADQESEEEDEEDIDFEDEDFEGE